MITGLSHALFVRIEQLVSGSINKKAMRLVKKELSLIVSCIGLDAEKHLLRCLMKES